MEVKFKLVKGNGEKITDMTEYDDAIFNILADWAAVYDAATIGEDWFSVSRIPTLEEILIINRNLVKLGLVIDA